MERAIRREREKAAIYGTIGKQGGDKEVKKLSARHRMRAAQMRREYEDFSKEHELAYYPERTSSVKGEDTYSRRVRNKSNISQESGSYIEKTLTTGGKSDRIGLQFFASKEKQFGKKVGKHAKDFGLDPSKSEDRDFIQKTIDGIVKNPDEIRIGFWRGQAEDVVFYIKGEDVVITKQDNEFVTILKGGISNPRVKNARNK